MLEGRFLNDYNDTLDNGLIDDDKTNNLIKFKELGILDDNVNLIIPDKYPIDYATPSIKTTSLNLEQLQIHITNGNLKKYLCMEGSPFIGGIKNKKRFTSKSKKTRKLKKTRKSKKTRK